MPEPRSPQAAGATHEEHVAHALRVSRYEERRRRRRRRAMLVLSAALALVGAWALVAHSALTRRMVIPRLESVLGASIEGGDVSIGLDGVVTIRNAVLRAPGVSGTGGAVFEVKRINVTPSLGRATGSGGRALSVSAVDLVEPLVRLSQSRADGSMNIAKIDLPSPAGGAPELPRITVERGVIELGEHWIDEHGRGQYAALKRLDIDGAVTPSTDVAQGVYRVELRQIDPGLTPPRSDLPVVRPLDLEGTVSEHGVSLTMSGLSLDDWPASAVPSRVRDIYRSLALEGRISRTRMEVDDRRGVRVELELEGVGVDLPISATEEPVEGPPEPGRPARMRDVNGTVRFLGGSVEAELDGLLEDLPYHVRLNYLGLSADAPFECDFSCENFRMEEKPQILRFAPPRVRYRLAQFSNPTGLVTARAHVSRGPPRNGEPAETRVTGTLDFTDVTAAYWSFPYRFNSITGHVRFDDRSVEILSLEGVAPGGGRISATAKIEPLTDDAAALIQVQASNITIDDRLEEAMGPRRRLVEEIASADQHRRLAERGAFLTPERRAVLGSRLERTRAGEAAATTEAARDAARREIAELEESLRAPVFEFRGRGDVSIRIERQPGPVSVWSELIDVRLGRVGLLPERFPLPVIADGVRVVIDGETVRVEGGEYRGLTGGKATVSATMRYPPISNPDLDPLPRAHIDAAGIPMDAVLAQAVAGAVDRATRGASDSGESESAAFVRSMLTGLRLSGTVSAVTDLESDEHGTHVRTQAASKDLSARPRRKGVEASLRADAATVRVTDSRIEVGLEGIVSGAGGTGEGGAVRLASTVDIARTGSSSWSAELDVKDLDLGAPVEPAVAVFSDGAADRIERVRESTSPSGRADVTVRLSGGEPGLGGRIVLEGLRGAELSVLGGRLRADSLGGAVLLTPFEPGREDAVRFEDFRVSVSEGGVSAGTVALDGDVAGLGTSAANGTLRVGVEAMPFEHPLLRRLAAEHAGQALHGAFERANPEGVFDATLSFARSESGISLRRGVVRPRSLALTLESGRAEWPVFTGEIEFEAGSGVFRDLRGRSPERPGSGAWSFGASGSWVIPAPGSVAVQATVNAEMRGMPAGFMAVLPPELTAAMKEISLTTDQAVRVSRADLTYNDDGTEAGRRVRVAGEVEFDGVSLEAGAPVTGCAGTLGFTVERPAGRPPEYDLAAVLSRLRFAGMEMTEGRLRLTGGGASGDVLVPLVTANCYGGRASGTMALRAAPGGARSYEASLNLAGVRFAPVMRDLGAGDEAGATPSDAAAADESRGRLDVQIALAGTVGDNAGRRGRGSGTVGGGVIVKMPLLLRLVEVSNLQLPLNETLTYAHSDFYIRGDTVVFEDVSAFSDSVRFLGYGTATWPGLDLDLRFSSRAIRRLPFISGLVEGIRDELLVSTSVRGPIRAPTVSNQPLQGASRMLETLFGSPSEQERLMREIERRALRNVDRVRTVGDRRASEPAGPGGQDDLSSAAIPRP